MRWTKRKKYWAQAVLWLGCIYLSLPLVRPICDFLKGIMPFKMVINVAFALVVVGVLVFVLRSRKFKPSTYSLILVALAIYVYGLFAIRIPEEKIHFIEYGFLAFFIHRAIRVDIRSQKSYVIAFLLAVVLGCIDEGIQHLLPGRYYDTRDIVINTLSAALGLFLDFIRRRERGR